MELKNKIFCTTNPARISDALWDVMSASNVAPADMLIFLPSRRTVRSAEEMILNKTGGDAVILPRMVALGEGADEFDDADDDVRGADVISNTERVAVIAKLLAADANIGGLAAALPVAHDLVRMTDYLENEGINAADLDWANLVDEKYAAHFQGKAQILNIISRVMPQYIAPRTTVAARRNADIRAWIKYIAENQDAWKLIIVCASTASVPATRDLMTAVARDARGRIILPGMIADKNLRESDMALATNPYNSEYKFLTGLGLRHTDITVLDTGPSAIGFMNAAFGNAPDAAPDAGVSSISVRLQK